MRYSTMVEREFDFGDQGKFKLQIHPAFIVSGRHLCSDRVVDHGTAYGPEGASITVRALSLYEIVIFCPSCGARVVVPVDIKDLSRHDSENRLLLAFRKEEFARNKKNTVN